MLKNAFCPWLAITLCLSLILEPGCLAQASQAARSAPKFKRTSRTYNSYPRIANKGRAGILSTPAPSAALNLIEEEPVAKSLEEPKVQLELSEAAAYIDKSSKQNTIVLSNPSSTERLQQLLSALPAATKPAASAEQFKFAPPLNTPQRPGKVINVDFNPAASQPGRTPKSESARKPLKVLRKSPEGSLLDVSQISVTFSEAMVPISESAVEAAPKIPIKIAPEPAGKWHWIGTQTLAFTSAGKHLPNATSYKVTIPKGIQSVSGNTLATAVSWNIEGSAAKLSSFFPPNASQNGDEPRKLDQCMVAIFDQQIDPARILPIIQVVEGQLAKPIRLATEKEINQDREIAGLVAAHKGKCVAFKTSTPLHANETVKISIGPKIPSEEGPLLQKDQLWTSSFNTWSPLSIDYVGEVIAPSGSLSISFNNSIDSNLFKPEMVSIEPKLPNMEATCDGGDITIAGDFKANLKYKVTLAKTITDIFGQKLGTYKNVSAHVRPLATMMIPKHPVVIIKAGKKPLFSFFSTNIKQMKVCIYACTPQDYRKYLKSKSEYQDYFRQDSLKKEFKMLDTKILSIPKTTEKYVETFVDLNRFLKKGCGNLILTAESWTGNKDSTLRFATWLQCTGIGLNASSDGRTVVTLATTLEDGRVIPQAKTSMEAEPNLNKVTDDNGLSHQALLHGEPTIIYCQKGEDQAFLPCTSSEGDWLPAIGESQQPSRRDSLRWYGVTDRGLYRPGEEVEMKGIVRRFGQGPSGDISIEKKFVDLLEYHVVDGNRSTIARGEAKVDDFGAYHFSFKIPPTANLGIGSVTIKTKKDLAKVFDNDSTGTSFKIEEFRRPEFELSIKPSNTNMVIGESSEFFAYAHYLAGGPLASAPIDWQVKSTDATYAPPGWDDFAFGAQESIDLSANASLKSQTDSSGKHAVSLRLKSLSNDIHPVSVSIQGSVTDVNRQEWTNTTSVLVHPASLYVGTKSKKQFYTANDDFELESIVTDLDGKAIAGRTVHIDLSHEVQTLQGGKKITKYEVFQSAEITSELTPSMWKARISKEGKINVKSTVIDSNGRKNISEISFWKEKERNGNEKIVEQDSLLILADRKQYSIGDTAELMVQSSFSGGQGFLTILHNGISKVIPVSLSTNSEKILLPITEDMLPNATIFVELVCANGKYATGTVDLDIPAVSRAISLDVIPTNKIITPGSKTSLNFKLKDSKGNGVQNSQIAVAVVDEAVLALAGYSWHDPMSIFYIPSSADSWDYHAKSLVLQTRAPTKPLPSLEIRPYSRNRKGRARGVRWSFAQSTYANLPAGVSPYFHSTSTGGGSGYITIQEPYLHGGGGSGYGGGMGEESGISSVALRSDLSALAYFNPALKTDANGNAYCEFKVPDNLTRYKIMAVAVAGEKFFGKGENEFTARRPLMVRPSAPRFLNFGDKCELPVVLQNQTDKDMSVDFVLRAANCRFTRSEEKVVFREESESNKPRSQTLTDDKDQLGLDASHTSGGSVVVPANNRVELRFPLFTEAAGAAAIDIAAISGDNRDAASVSFPVYTPATFSAFAAYGQIDNNGADQQNVEIPKNVFDQTGGLELSTSSTNLQSLTDAYIYLHDYSFACSEQLSSRILATTALQDVLSAFNKMTPSEIAATRIKIQEEIKELCKRQNEDGSFGLWKTGEAYKWPFVSIQVARALHEAKLRKYDIPAAAISKAKNYLKAMDSHLVKLDYNACTKSSIKAYALFVQHLMGDTQAGAARQLILSALSPVSSRTRGQTQTPISLSGKSQQDRLLKEFSLESLAWLLPVISADQSSLAEHSLLLSAISSQIQETASKASVTHESYDSSYTDFNYAVFYSDNRLDASVLEALIMDQPQNSVIPKLANALLAHRKAGRWESTQENSASILALTRYFNAYEKQIPDFVANTWIGTQFVSSNKFVGRSTETQVTTIPMKFLVDNPQLKDVLISQSGKGRLYYRLGLNYASKNLMPGSLENGFVVKRSYEGADNPLDVSKDSNGVWHFKSGAAVKVKIELTAAGQRHHVALTDPLPAGAEPINSVLAGSRLPARETTNSDFATQAGFETQEPFDRWSTWWYEHQNLRDFRAEAFASSLPSGKYGYTYFMRATTPGEYFVPPAKAEEMYTPETFGRTAGEKVVIE